MNLVPIVRVTIVTIVALAFTLAACGSTTADAIGGAGDAAAGTDATTGSDAASAKDGGGVIANDAAPPAPGTACGFMDSGAALHVASGVDLCMPHVACNAETCPPTLGSCVNDACVFNAGYSGVATLPEAWVTYYCELSTGGCHGVTQIEFPEITAQKIATAMTLPVCDGLDGGTDECVGIAASSPMVVGNSQLAVDSQSGEQVKAWGLGLTEASGLCYELTGPGGKVLVALTDRCGGYCTCSGSGKQECGPCVNAADMAPGCPCVGTAPPAYSNCCGTGCGGAVDAQCDWCATNNHPHFDLDTASFNRICGSLANQGSCKLSGARFVHCLDTTAGAWPPN
jgi:hypothetical protein